MVATAPLTEYEREREALIARNRARMAELGIKGLAKRAGLSPDQQPPSGAAAAKPKRPSPSPGDIAKKQGDPLIVF